MRPAGLDSRIDHRAREQRKASPNEALKKSVTSPAKNRAR